MAVIELTRSNEDRRLYELGPLGSLRLEGFWARRATATSAGVTWRIGRVGVFGRAIQCVGAGGALVGEFAPRSIRRGGELHWSGRTFELRPASNWRERYALAAGDVEVAVFEGKGWGKRPVKVDIARPEAIEPGLLLFTAFVVRGLAEDASSAAGATAAATTASTS
ncbi:MAG TPA: hypothetical protein VH247_04015 [Thermoleophilaceae bacterium]|jgi:hypothetical protein|nr:hypothetical protein [Thermoleophilaceae bacterium]